MAVEHAITESGQVVSDQTFGRTETWEYSIACRCGAEFIKSRRVEAIQAYRDHKKEALGG